MDEQELKTEAVSFRFSPETKSLLEKLSGHLNRSQVNTVEVAVREMAKREGVEVKWNGDWWQ